MRRVAFAICVLAFMQMACHRVKRTPVSEILLTDETHRDRILSGISHSSQAGGGWRWTAPAFAVSLDAPPEMPTYLEMDFTVPDELMNPPSPVTVIAKVNGAEAGRQTYDQSGRYVFAQKLPDSMTKTEPARVEFSVDRSVKEAGSQRDLGLIVVSVGLKPLEQTAEYRDREMAKSREAYANIIKQRDLKIPPEKQTEIMRIFHDLPIWESLTFQNVQIIKNPLDLWMLQQIAWEVRPDFIVETGTFWEWSAIWWAHTLNGMGLENARVLTVDIQDLEAGSVAESAVEEVCEVYPGEFDGSEDCWRYRGAGEECSRDRQSGFRSLARSCAAGAAYVRASGERRELYRGGGHASRRSPHASRAGAGPDGGCASVSLRT